MSRPRVDPASPDGAIASTAVGSALIGRSDESATGRQSGGSPSTGRLEAGARAWWKREAWPLGVLSCLVLTYVIVFSARSIAAYITVQTLFDLATFEQGFWRALQGTLFNYSLESPWPGGEISRFGRHFSPLFVFLLPLYAVFPDPAVLLILQSLALGVGALPLYWIARRRLRSVGAALLIVVAYLLSPMVHDVNLVNEFHEIAFSVPLLLTAWWALEARRWRWYGCCLVLILMVKEDLALTVITLGLYVLMVRRHRRVGLVTVGAGAIWLIAVVYVVMPALRGPEGAVPFAGYEYLGTDPIAIARGAISRPLALWTVLTEPAKLRYLFWILAPLAFLPLIGLETFAIATPALLIILASTYPWTYALFERYVAPVIPFAFIAAIVGVERLIGTGDGLARWVSARSLFRPGRLALIAASLVVALTGWALVALDKYPRGLTFAPDPHAASALSLIRRLPAAASVSAADHRWLAHLAHRQYLYFLSVESPPTDFVLYDTKVPPVTNVPANALARRQEQVAADPSYRLAAEADGIRLYGRRALPAAARLPEPSDGDLVKSSSPTVYVLRSGQLRPITNVETLLCHGPVPIWVMDDTDIAGRPQGPAVPDREGCA